MCLIESQEFEKRLLTIQTTQNKLLEEATAEGAKYGDDVKYLADFTSGCKKFDPWIQQSEAKKSVGIAKPTNLMEGQDSLDGAKVNVFFKGNFCIFWVHPNISKWIAT